MYATAVLLPLLAQVSNVNLVAKYVSAKEALQPISFHVVSVQVLTELCSVKSVMSVSKTKML